MGDLVGIFALLLIGFAIWQTVTLRAKREAKRHEETMAMIEKGIYGAPLPEPVYRKERYLLSLLAGVTLSTVGIALLLAFAVLSKHQAPLIIMGFLTLFPGLGFIGCYSFLSKKEQRERELREAQERARLPETP